MNPSEVERQDVMNAEQYALSYEGDFPFMQQMRAWVASGRHLSHGQAAAVVKCAAHDAKRQATLASKRGAADPVTEPGMYRVVDSAGNPTIFKVQRTREGNRLYAKRLTFIRGERLATDDGRIVHFEFEYAPGAINDLTASDRMTLDQAIKFGIEFGVCCVCGATLKDATSVQAGIGPVCAKRV